MFISDYLFSWQIYFMAKVVFCRITILRCSGTKKLAYLVKSLKRPDARISRAELVGRSMNCIIRNFGDAMVPLKYFLSPPK
jgi:hypothetical protein